MDGKWPDVETKDKLAYICKRFRLPGELTGYRLLSSGHINTTCAAVLSDGPADRTFLVQRVNRYVFRDPVGLMGNIDRVTRHIREKEGAAAGRGSLRFYHTAEGTNYVMLGEGDRAELWRVCDFIENAVSFEGGEGGDRVLRGAGRAFGRFLCRLRDLEPSRLTETIPHFHDTEYRMETLLQAVAEDPLGRAGEAARETGVIRAGRAFAGTLCERARRGELPVRVTHNDTRINNVLFHRDTLEPLAVVDLDTCMPGLVCYDFGDLVRSAAWVTAENGRGFRLDPARFRACAEGFLSETAAFLTGAELDSLAGGAAVITLELASRYLEDYLTGDRYFPIDYPTQNLDRARRQLALYQDMTDRMEELREIVDSAARSL